MPLPVTRTDVLAAHKTLRPHIRRTPVFEIDPSEIGVAAGRITFKLEQFQHSGSFKARGALNTLLTGEVPPAGVAAASGGNHGAAVAYAARALGHAAHIFVPEISSPAKRILIESYGATLHVGGARYADALAACEMYMAESGAMGIHAYDAPGTLAGQGTVALEFLEQAPVETLLVAVGGGGLIGGMAAYAEGEARLIAVEPETCPSYHAARAAGHPVPVEVSGLAADSLGARVAGTLMVEIAASHVAEAVLVTDDAIRAAQRLLWERFRIVVEPGGAAALAALTSGTYRPKPDEHVGVLLCGVNTDAVQFGA